MTTDSGSNNGLYFIVGALVVIVGVLAFFYFGGMSAVPSSEPSTTSSTSVSVDTNGNGGGVSGSVTQTTE